MEQSVGKSQGKRPWLAGLWRYCACEFRMQRVQPPGMKSIKSICQITMSMFFIITIYLVYVCVSVDISHLRECGVFTV